MDQDVLGAPLEPRHAPALEPGGEALRERDAQVAAAQLDPCQPVALQDGAQAKADGLHFGQFGHGAERSGNRPPALLSGR